ncbi:MAG: alanine--tRNA ligase-related protein [Candidatus Nanohaloarchaea archaeon]
MKGLDELKEEIQDEASQNPEKFFATDVLREKGFSRGRCENCGRYFWSSKKDRKVCGEPECSGGYTFINDSPTEETYSYIEAWELFEEFMTERGYSSIDRYPVVARWRDDVEFTGASIYCFQPDVVSGKAEPPAPELIIPQPSLRFNDVDNVGITGRHYVLHDHIGQTCFQPPEKYDQDRYFRDMFEFAVEALGIPEEKLILHEDSWGGGGNLGASMEFFVDGLELWNQVYMFYKQTPDGYEELDLKVLDMGMGHERITWISRGSETSYESVMPETLEKMKERTGLEIDQEVWERFLPHSSELNVDEVEDIDEKWREIAEKIGEDVDDLKEEIKPAAALYSVAEHMRALIFALSDGKIPSNTGGGHNLRMIYRRAKDFVERYDWDIDLKEVARWNAEELEPMFPELLDSMNEIEEILDVEEEKYSKAREKAEKKLNEVDEQPSLEEMIELYESHGVSPEMMEEHGYRVPEDFYMKIGSEEEAVEEVEEEFDLEGLNSTEKLYYERREPYRNSDSRDFSFTATVEAVVEEEWVVLDRTMFYPQGGGQEYDEGTLDGFKVEEVQKQGDIVLHRAPEHRLKEGDKVEGTVDGEKRKQLTQHHSSTHMVNAAAREELGSHIFQAGAKKTGEKARLDITHYEKPSQKEIDRIEEKVESMIEKGLEIRSLEMKKSEAEQRYGFRIYQGGAPPGNNVRLIEIEERDIEACGGTHLTRTSHAGEFYITGTKRIQDGVIRLEYKAGKAAENYMERIENRVSQVSKMLDTEISSRPRKAERELCSIFSVEPEHLTDTVERFLQESEKYRERIEKLSRFLDVEPDFTELNEETAVQKARALFNQRKNREKKVEKLESQIEEFLEKSLQESGTEDLEAEVPTENVGLLIQVAQKLSSKYEARVTLIGEKGAVSASETGKSAEKALEEYSSEVQGDESFAKAFDIS